MAEPSPPKPLLSPEQGLRRTIVYSLLLHVLVLALFAGDFLPRRKIDERPVYVVDLLNLPVKDPQAGRPDAAREPQKTPDKNPEPPAVTAVPEKAPEAVKLPPKTPEPPKPEPVKPEPVKPEPAKPVKKPEVVKPVPAKEPPPKPTPAKEPAKDSVAEAIATMEAEKLKKELLDKIASLSASKDTRGRGTDAPVGMPDAKGTQAGVRFDEWIETNLRERWHFPTQLTTRCDLETVVEIVFDPKGRRVSERIIRKSGEEAFDESVLRAVLKLKELPNPPDERLKLDVPFNLKDTPQCKK